jgi:hypothetical protein
MSMDTTVDEILQRLTDWACFPKYQLERRLDIFLTPFIEQFVGQHLEPGVEFQAELVAPEFPLLARLDPKRKQPNRRSRKPSALTVNADYLLYARPKSGGPARWVFLELKTDPRSFKTSQLRLYEIARDRKMVQLVKDLEEVGSASDQEDKYHHLRKKLAKDDAGRARSFSAPIQIAYLAPPPARGFPGGPTPPGALPTCFWDFRAFETLQPTSHERLWRRLRPLLAR